MDTTVVKVAGLLGCALVMAVNIGTAIGQGLIGMKACETIGKYPENSSAVRTAMLLSLTFVETCALYGLLVAGFILYYVRGL